VLRKLKILGLIKFKVKVKVKEKDYPGSKARNALTAWPSINLYM
jgi:hypothetical protein